MWNLEKAPTDAVLTMQTSDSVWKQTESCARILRRLKPVSADRLEITNAHAKKHEKSRGLEMLFGSAQWNKRSVKKGRSVLYTLDYLPTPPTRRACAQPYFCAHGIFP